MIDGFTFYQNGQHCNNWTCSARTSSTKCKARIRFDKMNNVKFFSGVHSHDPPELYVSRKGEYFKVKNRLKYCLDRDWLIIIMKLVQNFEYICIKLGSLDCGHLVFLLKRRCYCDVWCFLKRKAYLVYSNPNILTLEVLHCKGMK